MNKFYTSKKGFSIYLAVIMSAALLTVAVSVSKISSSSLKYVNINKESQAAYFAAEAGLECALYWDTYPSVSAFDYNTANTITCLGQVMSGGIALPNGQTSLVGGGGASNYISNFLFYMEPGASQTSKPCVYVTVSKAGFTTIIKSRGYNICSFSDPRILERGIDTTY